MAAPFLRDVEACRICIVLPAAPVYARPGAASRRRSGDSQACVPAIHWRLKALASSSTVYARRALGASIGASLFQAAAL